MFLICLTTFRILPFIFFARVGLAQAFQVNTESHLSLLTSMQSLAFSKANDSKCAAV